MSRYWVERRRDDLIDGHGEAELVPRDGGRPRAVVRVLFDEMVERGAKEHWTRHLAPTVIHPVIPPTWEELSEDGRETVREQIRPILRAALGEAVDDG